MLHASLLNQTASLYTVTKTADACGSIVETKTLAGTFKCRVRAVSLKEKVDFGREGVRITHKVWLQPNTGLSPNETSEIVVAGRTFNVKTVDDPHEIGHHIKVMVEEVVSHAG